MEVLPSRLQAAEIFRPPGGKELLRLAGTSDVELSLLFDQKAGGCVLKSALIRTSASRICSFRESQGKDMLNKTILIRKRAGETICLVEAQSDLPAKEILERGEYFRYGRGSGPSHQDIRPIQIAILNLMPLKEDTELQLSPFPFQYSAAGGCDLCPGQQATRSKNTSTSHLNKFYVDL